MIMISKFLLKFTNFCVIICFLNQTTNIRFFFPTAVNAVLVTKPLTSGILYSNSVGFLVLTRSVTSGVFFSNSVLSV